MECEVVCIVPGTKPVLNTWWWFYLARYHWKYDAAFSVYSAFPSWMTYVISNSDPQCWPFPELWAYWQSVLLIWPHIFSFNVLEYLLCTGYINLDVFPAIREGMGLDSKTCWIHIICQTLLWAVIVLSWYDEMNTVLPIRCPSTLASKW